MTGDYMRALLATVDPNIPLRTVHGMKGKVSRAQGPSSLFVQGRIHTSATTSGCLRTSSPRWPKGDDRNRMKDDRADGWVWAMLHLSGTGQGNWAQVYGFRDCHKCGARVNEDKDKRCHNCGARDRAGQAEACRGQARSGAVVRGVPARRARSGHKYTPAGAVVPGVRPEPRKRISRGRLAAQQGGGGGSAYTGGNWLAGRRILRLAASRVTP